MVARMTRTITIHSDGALTALHSRHPSSLPLIRLGKATITRTTDILFHAERQQWYAIFLEGEFSGCKLTTDIARKADVPLANLRLAGSNITADATLYFATDNDCILAEHLIVNGLRKNGYMLNNT